MQEFNSLFPQQNEVLKKEDYRTFGEVHSLGKAPNKNDDSAFSDPDTGTLAAFDGVGGSADGRLASSQVASDVTISLKESGLSPTSNTEVARELIKVALQKAHIRLAAANRQRALDERLRSSEKYTPPLTTASVVHINRDEGKVTVGNVGDSRVYAFDRESQQLRLLTTDDNLLKLNFMYEAKAKILEKYHQNNPSQEISTFDDIPDDERHKAIHSMRARLRDTLLQLSNYYTEEHIKSLTPDQFKNIFGPTIADAIGLKLFIDFFRKQNRITAAIGSINSQTLEPTELSPEVISFDLKPSEIVLVVTDGVSDNFTTDELLELLSSDTLKNASPSTIAFVITEIARDFAEESSDGSRKGKKDDITAVVYG